MNKTSRPLLNFWKAALKIVSVVFTYETKSKKPHFFFRHISDFFVVFSTKEFIKTYFQCQTNTDFQFVNLVRQERIAIHCTEVPLFMSLFKEYKKVLLNKLGKLVYKNTYWLQKNFNFCSYLLIPTLPINKALKKKKSSNLLNYLKSRLICQSS